MKQEVTTRDILEAIHLYVAHTDKRFDKIDAKFDAIDARFAQNDERFNKIDGRLDNIDKRIDKVDRRLASIDGKILDLKVDMAVMTRREVERHEERLHNA